MNAFGTLQLGAATLIFLLAANAAKVWTVSPSLAKLVLVLLLYSLGNLIMLRLIRDFGLGLAISLSGVIQLLAVNAIAFAFYRESVNGIQAIGLLLSVAGVALITLGPYLTNR